MDKSNSPEVVELVGHHGGSKEAVRVALIELDARDQLNSFTITDTAQALHISPY